MCRSLRITSRLCRCFLCLRCATAQPSRQYPQSFTLDCRQLVDRVLWFRFSSLGCEDRKGQRSIQGDPTAIDFVSTQRAVNGGTARDMPPLKPYVAGSTGTVNVHSHIATEYIETVVYRTESGHSAVWQRSLDQPTFTMANVRAEGPSRAWSSVDHLGGVDPTVGLGPGLSETQELII